MAIQPGGSTPAVVVDNVEDLSGTSGDEFEVTDQVGHKIAFLCEISTHFVPFSRLMQRLVSLVMTKTTMKMKKMRL